MPPFYYDDFKEGQTFTTPSRTVTETDVVLFASLTGDNNPLHTDEEAAKETRFEGRIAHGLLGASLAVGLWCRLGLVDGTALAFLETHWKFVGPIKLQDTITALLTVKSKRQTSKPEAGIVVIDFLVQNQAQLPLLKGSITLLVKTKDHH